MARAARGAAESGELGGRPVPVEGRAAGRGRTGSGALAARSRGTWRPAEGPGALGRLRRLRGSGRSCAGAQRAGGPSLGGRGGGEGTPR